MTLQQIDRRADISPEEFFESYYKPGKPVVLTDLAKNWPATQKWSFDYLIQKYGHLEVPIIGPDFHKPGPNYMKSTKRMKLGDYLQLIRSEPTDYRIFLWNIFEHAPDLRLDAPLPTNYASGFRDKFPFMFFGGAGSATNLHYDIDCPNIFHTHFATRKQFVLFDPTQGRNLYQHPFTLQSHVNPLNPDYDKYPALRKAVGYETILHHGETIFMPPLWWHYIVYLDGGFSIALRSKGNLNHQTRGLWNIARHFVIDQGMNKVLGPRWKQWKERQAFKRAI